MFLWKAPDLFKWLWHAVFWIYPSERGFIIIVSTLLGVPPVKIWQQTATTERVK